MWSLYCDLSATLWKWSSELLILRTNIADKHSTIMGTGIVQIVTPKISKKQESFWLFLLNQNIYTSELKHSLLMFRLQKKYLIKCLN